jgi:hypothetical protein
MPSDDYGNYIDVVSEDIVNTVEEMKCQPILFIGSGLSQRYFDGPDWEELLEKMWTECPEVDREMEYYLQKDITLPEIGDHLSEAYYEWGWNSGTGEFPDKLRDRENPQDIFLKYKISEYFKKITPSDIESIGEDVHDDEIEALREIQPHSVITTNYDTLLETIFPEYETIVGESILTSPHESVGEIMKIHGCVSEPESLILTQDDLQRFNDRKKYLSSKLLTYFAEHPVLIAGYSLNDPNIKKILSDIDEILSPDEGIIENIYFLDWKQNVVDLEAYLRRKRISIEDDKEIDINYIVASDFEWVFNSFASGGKIEPVNLKLLRSILANTYDIVREKAPRQEINIDYDSLKLAAESEEGMATLFGVTTMDNPPDFTAYYRYRLTEVGQELGYDSWHGANDLIKQVKSEKGINIKESDNKYHVDVNPHGQSQHRYSDHAIELLRKVKNGEDYEVDISESLSASVDEGESDEEATV